MIKINALKPSDEKIFFSSEAILKLPVQERPQAAADVLAPWLIRLKKCQTRLNKTYGIVGNVKDIDANNAAWDELHQLASELERDTGFFISNHVSLHSNPLKGFELRIAKGTGQPFLPLSKFEQRLKNAYSHLAGTLEALEKLEKKGFVEWWSSTVKNTPAQLEFEAKEAARKASRRTGSLRSAVEETGKAAAEVTKESGAGFAKIATVVGVTAAAAAGAGLWWRASHLKKPATGNWREQTSQEPSNNQSAPNR